MCNFFFFLLIWERERVHAHTCPCDGQSSRGPWREGEPQANSLLSTELHMGLDPSTLKSQPELKPRVRCLTDWHPKSVSLFIFGGWYAWLGSPSASQENKNVPPYFLPVVIVFLKVFFSLIHLEFWYMPWEGKPTFFSKCLWSIFWNNTYQQIPAWTKL